MCAETYIKEGLDGPLGNPLSSQAIEPSSTASLAPDGLQSGVGHTPGPWRSDSGGEDYYNRPEGASETIGIFGGDADFCLAVMVTDVFPAAEIEANANLIAAAPAVREAALALYMAGKWTCDRPVADAQLWENLRDALGLPAGTATAAGTGAA